MKLIKQIVKGYILWIWYYLNKSYREKRKTEAKRRIEICESCEYFYKPARNCMICGCFMDVKTKGDYDIYNGRAIFKNEKSIIYVCDGGKW